jgi:predicted ArsR family transcriptional regulator
VKFAGSVEDDQTRTSSSCAAEAADAPDRSGSTDHAATRTRVVRSLVDEGPATAAALAQRLGLTPGGVRRHLEALASDGLVQAADEPPYGPRAPRRRGRPAKVYSVTEAGRSTGTGGDATLAREVLRHLRTTMGDDAVRDFAESRLDDQRHRFAQALTDVPLEDRARELARLLTAEGFAASVDEVPGTAIGIQICQHDCPVAQVATEFPELCDAESRMFAEVLGTHVQRLATLAHGDGVCTTHMPAVLAAARLSSSLPSSSSSDRSNPARPLDRSTR